MLIEEIYEFIQFLKRQGQSQYFSPEEVIGHAFNRASLDLYMDEHKKFEDTSVIGDNLRNFKRTIDIARDEETKLFLLPTGKEDTTPIDEYFNWTNIGSLVTEDSVETEYRGKFYTDGEWIEANTSSLLPPELKNIQARIVKGGIDVKPIAQEKIRFYYLTKPATAVYAYDPEGGKIVFKTTGSVDPDWPITAHKWLIMRTMKYLGISMTDELLVKAEEFVKLPMDN